MTNCTKRVLTAAALILLAGIAAALEYFEIMSIKYLLIGFVAAMLFEWIAVMFDLNPLMIWKKKTKSPLPAWRRWAGIAGIAYFILAMAPAAENVGGHPWIILLLLFIISAADIGAWFFGRLLGGDKMWEKLSAGKTWSGQIAGILCGTLASVMYGLLGTDAFLPQLLWIGISVSLLSQYGDLTASWIKRKIGIKDFGNLLPGHGGLMDRFDGWIYVLPIVWLVML
ncbi:MAG: phosphatidate cytidylyltransferase [Rickettsiales bacterium]|jgi:phosphatidate cytidylyltransferase|nr:phosphatidate cytidylyltransferase [Rickettsiales bacterium]